VALAITIILILVSITTLIIDSNINANKRNRSPSPVVNQQQQLFSAISSIARKTSGISASAALVDLEENQCKIKLIIVAACKIFHFLIFF
jgi:hypothetical protein